MTEVTPPKSGYNINSIRLSKCEFYLNNSNAIVTEGEVPKADISVESIFEIQDKKIKVDVTLSYSVSNSEENSEVKAFITMTGIFEAFGETSIPMENFGKANGPAIIYPYVREQFSSLMVKAGLGYHFLPALNFAQKASHTIKGK